MSELLKKTELYQALARKSQSMEDVLDPTKFLSMVTTATDDMADLLNRTCANFPDYTLHDEKHALRVVILMRLLMGEQIVERLSAVDLALLILSAYGHDTGMAIGREKREELQESEDYKEFLLRNEDQWLEAENARESGDAQLYEHLFSRMFQDFLRDRHHLLSAELMEGEFAQRLTVEGKRLAKPVADLCRSHGESVPDLARYGDFPFAGRFLSDVPFLACVLRLADYLDLDPARAPASLMELVKPDNEKSRREWRKHQATNFFVTATEIRFAAKFDDFFEEKALCDTLAGIENERRMCMDFLRARPDPARLRLLVEAPVKKDIESDGYVYEEFRFRLEYREIIALLMGTRLYRDERVFIRELLQNALDACRHAEAGSTAAGREGYGGRIVVRMYATESGQEVLEVSDNGAGMTRSIINDYFMRVGRSYYQSFAFRRKQMAFQPISQFGIGILSCFMRSDYLEVETRPDPMIYHDEADRAGKGLKLEIRGPRQFFVVRELPHGAPGTTVRVFLNKPLTESLSSLVQRFLSRTPYSVEIHDHDDPPTELRNQAFDFSDERFSHCFVAMPDSFGYASRDLVLEGRFGFELKGRLRLFMLEAQDRRYLQLRDAGKYSLVGFSAYGGTLVNVERLTDAVRQKLNAPLNQVRVLTGHFSAVYRSDLENIIRCFDRVCDHLMHRHGTEEVVSHWSALTSQIEALTNSEAFQANPACLTVRATLAQATTELESFATGSITLSWPAGILTQDGINLSSFVMLPSLLSLGIGFLYNLDLCGKHRLTLNAARDGLVIDDKLDAFVTHIQSEVGAFLGKWFHEEDIPSEQLAEFVRSTPKPLGSGVAAAIDKLRGENEPKRAAKRAAEKGAED